MTDNLKTAFDGIRAEDRLKSGTMLFLQREMQKRSKARTSFAFKRLTAVLACSAVMLLSGVFSHNLYFTPSAYVDVDINPSAELAVNRFDRIIGVHAYNADGEAILSEIDLKHKRYEAALIMLLEAVNQKGYIQNDGLVTVTLQTGSRENEMLANIQNGVTGFIHGHHETAQIDVFPVSGETRNHAHEQGISPAKYLAIQELIAVDITASIENSKSHSISEIRQLTQEHMGNHHGGNWSGNGNGGNITEPAAEDWSNNDYEDCETPDRDVQEDNRNHDDNNNRHHGGGHE